jgi:hypothetical protein
MSIGIAIAVPDGIALAADTQTTWQQRITKAKDKQTGNEFELADPIQVPVGWSRMARKLFAVDMAGNTYSIVTAGEAQLNSKTMYAVFRSAAKQYTGTGAPADVSQYFANHLKSQLAMQHSCAVTDLNQQSINVCEYILAGYEDKDVAKPFLESHMVFSGTLKINKAQNTSGHLLKWTNTNEGSRYGGCWIGRAAYITHIVKHSNKDLPPISGQYHMMTLADAVDYTRFLVAFTCDFQRFAVTVPDCGRPIVSARLNPEHYDEQIFE